LSENPVPSLPRGPESGITALEYALLGSLVALGLIVGATAFGTQLGDAYENISDTVKDAVGL
jgi:pilus assembly protein Flp/PilA